MSEKIKWVKINWSPFATNVLDAHLFTLCTPDGIPVEFRRSGMDFVLRIYGQDFRTDDNLQASYWMNQNEIGGVRKPPPAPQP